MGQRGDSAGPRRRPGGEDPVNGTESTRPTPTSDVRLSASRGADRHVVAALAEHAQQESYELLTFSSAEKRDRDGIWTRTLTIKLERVLDDLESIL